jgi:hypothetical protein
MKRFVMGWVVWVLAAWPMMADAAGAPADQGLIAVPEEGPLNGLAARVLNEGNPIKVTPKIAMSLGLVLKAETVYVAYDKNVKDGNALEDIRVSRQRGKTDIVLGAMDPATKTLTLYLTSPSGVLEKAVASGKNDYAEVPQDQAQAGFQKAVDFWTKTLPPLKTGSFEATFTTRSPLSEMKALTQRLAYSGDTTDYDLSSETFLVYVPEKYNPKKPVGLLVLANYKPTDSLPDPVLPQLADANMAMVVAKDMPDQWWQRAGFALDAVYNLEQQYKIDPRRVYIFGSFEWPVGSEKQPILSERLGLNYPEVFTGIFTDGGVYAYMRVQGSNGGFWDADPEMPEPNSRFLSAAKKHPWVMSFLTASDEEESTAKAFQEEGFTHVKYATITADQFHYPNYTTDWLPDVLKFMDAATADLDLSPGGDDLSSTEAEP